MPTPPFATIADVYAARQVVARHLAPTPLLHSPGLSRLIGAEIYVKYEDMTPIRSFKLRGALYCLSRLPPGHPGVVCASTGNHGQGMALAARLTGRRAVVVVPTGTPERKKAAIKHVGGELRAIGSVFAESAAIARDLARAEGLEYVEDGENPDVMVGCATMALEVVEQLPDLDRMIVPVGGGNLIAACGLVLDALRPAARLVGVQAAGAPAVYESWRRGEPVRLARCETFAGGVATSFPGAAVFPLVLARVHEMRLVDDDAIRAAAIAMLAETGHLPEGAAAAPLAALLADAAARPPTERAGDGPGKSVIVLSGGNAEPEIWDALREGASPPAAPPI